MQSQIEDCQFTRGDGVHRKTSVSYPQRARLSDEVNTTSVQGMLNTYHNFIPQIAFQTVLAKMFVTNFKPNSNKLTNNPSCVEFYAHSTYTPHSTQTSNSITRATGIIHTHFYSVMQFQVNQQIAQIRRSRPPRSNWFAIYQKHVILIHSVHHIHLADKSIYRIHKNANYKKDYILAHTQVYTGLDNLSHVY